MTVSSVARRALGRVTVVLAGTTRASSPARAFLRRLPISRASAYTPAPRHRSGTDGRSDFGQAGLTLSTCVTQRLQVSRQNPCAAAGRRSVTGSGRVWGYACFRGICLPVPSCVGLKRVKRTGPARTSREGAESAGCPATERSSGVAISGAARGFGALGLCSVERPMGTPAGGPASRWNSPRVPDLSVTSLPDPAAASGEREHDLGAPFVSIDKAWGVYRPPRAYGDSRAETVR